MWLNWPANLETFCTNPEILGEIIRVVALLLSVFFGRMQALSQGFFFWFVLCRYELGIS